MNASQPTPDGIKKTSLCDTIWIVFVPAELGLERIDGEESHFVDKGQTISNLNTKGNTVCYILGVKGG